MSARDRRLLLAVLGIAVVLYGMFLPAIGIMDPDEGRHVSIPAAMLRTGDFLVPRLQGYPYLEKPPLTYWMTAASYSLFGRSETSARLPVALMGFIGTLAIAWLAWRAVRPGAAWIAAALSVLTTHWFIQARYLTTDMILAGWMTIALCAFAVAALTGRRRVYWLFYIAAALATLAKGVIGFLLPAVVVVSFIVLSGRWRLLREMRPLAGSALGVAIVLPWFLMVQARIPDFLRYFIFDQHLARFASNGAEHAEPLWYFLPVLAFGFFPWLLHLPVGLPRAPRGSGFFGRFRRADPLALLLWIWLGVIVGFFSASAGKIAPYILPAYPPLVLLAAARLARLRRFGGTESGEVSRGTCHRSLVAGTIILLAAPILWFGLQRFIAADGRMTFEEVRFWAWALIGLPAAGGLIIVALAIRRSPAGTLAAQAGYQILFFLLMIGGGRATDPYLSPRVIGDFLARNVRPGDLVLLYEVANPSLEFYLGHPPTLVAWTGECAYGMIVEPDPEYYIPDRGAIRDLLSSGRTVYVVANSKDTTLPESFGAPVELVASNRKRLLFRNLPSPGMR